jgi:hypothetical protein
VEASTKAIKQDPEYGLAYYNRALVLERMGKKSRATKDLKRPSRPTSPPLQVRGAQDARGEGVNLLYPRLGGKR